MNLLLSALQRAQHPFAPDWHDNDKHCTKTVRDVFGICGLIFTSVKRCACIRLHLFFKKRNVHILDLANNIKD